jgi:hypothetical protein
MPASLPAFVALKKDGPFLAIALPGTRDAVVPD